MVLVGTVERTSRCLVLLATLVALSSCATPRFQPQAGFVSRPTLDNKLTVVIFADVTSAEEAGPFLKAFGEGLAEGFTYRGYVPTVMPPTVNVVTDAFVLNDRLDAPEAVRKYQQNGLAAAGANGGAPVVVVHVELRRTFRPPQLPQMSLEGGTLQAYASLHCWTGEQLWFFRDMTYATNWFPIWAEDKALGNGRLELPWYGKETALWAAEFGRDVLAKVPARTPVQPVAVDPAGFAPPDVSAYPYKSGYTTAGTWPQLPGHETRIWQYGDRRGNVLFELFNEDQKRWGWLVAPRDARSYLLLDSNCTGKFTQRWPSLDEHHMLPPACTGG
jgi:hypothetical protein